MDLNVKDFDNNPQLIVDQGPLGKFGGEDQAQALLPYFQRLDFSRDHWTFVGQGFGPAKLDSGSGVLEIILELAAVDPDLKGGGLWVNIAKHQEEIFSFEGQKNWTERTGLLKLLFCKDIEHGGFLLHGAQTTKKVTGLDVVTERAHGMLVFALEALDVSVSASGHVARQNSGQHPLRTSVRDKLALHRQLLQELLSQEVPLGPHGPPTKRADGDLGLALVAKDVAVAALVNRGALGDLQADGALQALLKVSDRHAVI